MIMLQKSPVLWRENSHLIEVANLKEGEWSCYRGGQFKGERMVMLHFNRRENGHVKEVVFNGVSMVMLQRRSV